MNPIRLSANQSKLTATAHVVALLLAAFVLIPKPAFASQLTSKAAFEFGRLELNVLSPDGTHVIGSTRFTVWREDETEEIIGETRYLNGESDNEVDHLDVRGTDSRPRLDSYEHSFYRADGSIAMLDTLDAKTGIASCTSYSKGDAKVRKSKLDVPGDTFTGASELMLIVGSLRQGVREIKFHAFACVSGPRIFAVETTRPVRRERWSLYPGDLVRLDMRPDLGALNLLVAPFMPTMDAWFNPNDNWNYVGGEFDRYFRGPHVLTVRVGPGHDSR